MIKDDQFIAFGAPDIREDEIEEVVNTLKSGWIGTGEKVKKFEKFFSEYKDVPHNNVLAVNSCTAALHLALIVSGIGDGDEVITTATTFCATANAIIHSGAKPVFVDIDPESLNIDTNLIEKEITSKTRAIIPVHMAGMPCDMDTILDIAKKYDLIVIEDCAHAIESEYKGKKLGTMGNFGCFSFYTTKNIVTAEGGMLIGKNEYLINDCRMLSLHGMDNDAWKRFGSSGYKGYSIKFAGFKYNMTDINASLGIHQLSRVEESRKKRKQIYNQYLSAFDNLPLLLPPLIPHDLRHAFHLFVLRVDNSANNISRDGFMEKLKANNIGSGIHYKSLVEHDYYRSKFNLNMNCYKESISYGRSTLSLPLSSALDESSVGKIIDSVKQICS